MKKCLIVVDYQIDFVSGSLGFEKAKSLEKGICKEIDIYHKNKQKVIFTFDTHDKNYLDTNEGKNLPIEHCIIGTDGHKLYGLVAEKIQDTDLSINKPSFGSTELFEYLKKEEFDQIELCGVVTNICVISNAVLAKTACPNSYVFINKALVASNDEKQNDYALKVMESLQIKII